MLNGRIPHLNYVLSRAIWREKCLWLVEPFQQRLIIGVDWRRLGAFVPTLVG